MKHSVIFEVYREQRNDSYNVVTTSFLSSEFPSPMLSPFMCGAVRLLKLGKAGGLIVWDNDKHQLILLFAMAFTTQPNYLTNFFVMDTEHDSPEERPYRSHMHPACLPCRARKSRCITRHASSSSCVMCQTQGTDCLFPEVAQRSRRKRGHSRRNTSSRERHAIPPLHNLVTRRRCLLSTSPTMGQRPFQSYTTPGSEKSSPTNEATADHQRCPSPSIGHQGSSISALIDIIAESEQGTSHVVSPAIADDDRVFQEYLFSDTTYGQSRRMVRFHLNLNNPSQHTRPILFNTVPKRGKRESESRSLAVSYCEIIEKLVEPYQNDLINLWAFRMI